MLKGPEPLVSIITLNYNQTSVTCDFLASTRMLSYSNYEILVCDMASEIDPTSEISRGNYPKTKLLLSKTNLGFAGGNNWGIRQAKGSYILIINNDTEVTPNLISLLLQPFIIDASIAAISPKIKFYSNPGVIQYAGFGAMNNFTGRSFTRGELQQDDGRYDTSGYTNAAHGCAMMVKKEVLLKTGMFPETFFLYYEEWDLSARIKKAGFTIWYRAEAVVFHKESMSVGKLNPMKSYYLVRNRILYMRRNVTKFQLTFFMFFFILFTVPKSVVSYLLKGKYLELRLFFRAVYWNLSHSSYSVV